MFFHFSLSNGEVHVDAYGFKHVFSDNGLLLHYLCMELTQHYTMQAGTYEEHQRRWTYFMRQHGKCVTNNVSVECYQFSHVISNSLKFATIIRFSGIPHDQHPLMFVRDLFEMITTKS